LFFYLGKVLIAKAVFVSFTNREDIDFSNANELPAQQKLELVEDHSASVDYPLQCVGYCT
jgi:hypothetical protein